MTLRIKLFYRCFNTQKNFALWPGILSQAVISSRIAHVQKYERQYGVLIVFFSAQSNKA